MIDIKLFNTLTRNKERLVPITPGKIGLYTCGPTVYSRAHIGNFRTFLFEDILKRTLEAVGYKVHHVMNITDIDDKTIKKANEESKSLNEITEKYTAQFIEDVNLLQLKPANDYPKATEHIDDMIKMIQQLIDKNIAYLTDDGSVFFSIEKYGNYGQLVNLDLSGQKSTERIESDEYSKDNPQDFALWKKWKKTDGNIFWNSPWGKGRPGWHLECSAMSTKYLGNHFDLHCGGIDNIFPHHENEIAQTCGSLNTKFVNIWLHGEHLVLEDSKMSKSLGNIHTVPELINAGHSSQSIRFALTSSHYRSKLSFSNSKLEESKKSVRRVNDTYKSLKRIANISSNLPEEYNEFILALCDDLNTPQALAVLFNYIRDLNRRLNADDLSSSDAAMGLNFISSADQIFSILQPDDFLPQEIEELVIKREIARKTKDWSLSDDLRNELKSRGWIIEDTPEGTKCYKL